MKKIFLVLGLCSLFACSPKLNVVSETQIDTLETSIDTSFNVFLQGETFTFDSIPSFGSVDTFFSTPSNPGAQLIRQGEKIYIKTPADTVFKTIAVPGRTITKYKEDKILVPTIPWWAWIGVAFSVIEFLLIVVLFRTKA